MNFRTLAPLLLLPALLHADTIKARYPEGTTRGFLVLENMAGETIAIGDETQNVRGGILRGHLVFHFTDGSIDDDTSTYTQRGGVFHLLTDHHIQHGPSFPHPSDVTINTANGTVTSRITKDGKPELKTTHVDMPPDLYNGMIQTVVKNLPANSPEVKFSYLINGDKPRIIHFAVTPHEEDPFTIAGTPRHATHFVIKIELGGIEGVVAPIVGKKPEDVHIWIAEDGAPAFVREQGQMFEGGPVWRMHQTSPAFPTRPDTKADRKEEKKEETKKP